MCDFGEEAGARGKGGGGGTNKDRRWKTTRRRGWSLLDSALDVGPVLLVPVLCVWRCGCETG